MQVEQTQAQPATPSAASTPSSDAGSSARHAPETRGGYTDPFSQAFNSAQDDLAAKQRDDDAASRDTQDEDEAPAQAAQTQQPATAPASDATPATQAAPVAPQPTEPPAYWSREKKEAFKFQPRDVQEAWLAADPEPNARWDAQTKEAFLKLPRDAKEIYLTQFSNLERGFNDKFQKLATERKFAEEMRAAVSEPIRAYMTQHGLTEPQVFSRLLELQQQSVRDPAGYLRAFVANNKLDPAQVFGVEIPQAGAPIPVEMVQSHPAYQQIATQFENLQREVQQERARVAEAESRRFQAEYEQIVSQRDGEGKPLYPYIRLLADPMARIIEENPELFGSMGTSEKFQQAYTIALEQFPELMPLKRTAVPPPADVPAVKDAHTAAEEKRAENVERALTPKPRTPTPSPKANGSTGDPLDDALRAASRQLGMR